MMIEEWKILLISYKLQLTREHAADLTVLGAVTSIGKLYITSSQCNRMQLKDASRFSLAAIPLHARTQNKNCVHNIEITIKYHLFLLFYHCVNIYSIYFHK